MLLPTGDNVDRHTWAGIILNCEGKVCRSKVRFGALQQNSYTELLNLSKHKVSTLLQQADTLTYIYAVSYTHLTLPTTPYV